MKYINDISLTRLTNNAHYEFMNIITSRCAIDTKVKDRATVFVNALYKAFADENKYSNISKKSEYTELISSFDKERDKYYMAIKKIVTAKMLVPVAEEVAASTAINEILKKYSISTKMQLDTKTAAIINLCQDLKSEKNVGLLDIVGITNYVDKLSVANLEVRRNISNRTDEKKDTPIAALSNARSSCDDAYSSLMQVIDTYALLEGASNYESFINYVNAEIVRYKQQVITKTSQQNDYSIVNNNISDSQIDIASSSAE